MLKTWITLTVLYMGSTEGVSHQKVGCAQNKRKYQKLSKLGCDKQKESVKGYCLFFEDEMNVFCQNDEECHKNH